MKPYYEQDGITIYHGRTENVLPMLGDKSVSLVATDPPFFRVKAEEWDRQWKGEASFLSWVGDMADQWRRVLRPNGSLYVFASAEMAWGVEGEIRKRFNVLNRIRWMKPEGWHNKAEKESLRSYLSPCEEVIFAEQYADEYGDAAKSLHLQVYAPIGRRVQVKREAAGIGRRDIDIACSPSRKPTGLCYRWEAGDCLPTLEQWVDLCRCCGDRREYEDLRREYEDLRREYEDLRREYEDLRRPFSLNPSVPFTDVWTFPTVQPYPGKHPCEKPVSMMEHVVATSSLPGDVVLDCFMGYGPTIQAAKRLGRKAIGIDEDERCCRVTADRLRQGMLFGGAA